MPLLPGFWAYAGMLDGQNINGLLSDDKKYSMGKMHR